MRRRDFIKVIAGSATSLSFAAHAQQQTQMRRVGVLESAGIETDQQAGVAVFKEALRQLGWIGDTVEHNGHRACCLQQRLQPELSGCQNNIRLKRD